MTMKVEKSPLVNYQSDREKLSLYLEKIRKDIETFLIKNNILK